MRPKLFGLCRPSILTRFSTLVLTAVFSVSSFQDVSVFSKLHSQGLLQFSSTGMNRGLGGGLQPDAEWNTRPSIPHPFIREQMPDRWSFDCCDDSNKPILLLKLVYDTRLPGFWQKIWEIVPGTAPNPHPVEANGIIIAHMFAVRSIRCHSFRFPSLLSLQVVSVQGLQVRRPDFLVFHTGTVLVN